MKSLLELQVCAGISVLGATLLAPLLVKLNFLHEFLMYSLINQMENMFLLCALSIYALCNIVCSWRREHRIVITTVGLAFYVVALQGVVVIGLISVALLWVIPVCMYQFSEARQGAVL